jgi:hypothetical protein
LFPTFDSIVTLERSWVLITLVILAPQEISDDGVVLSLLCHQGVQTLWVRASNGKRPHYIMYSRRPQSGKIFCASSLLLEVVGNNDRLVSDKSQSITVTHAKAYRALEIHQDVERKYNTLRTSKWKVVQLESSVARKTVIKAGVPMEGHSRIVTMLS